MKKILINIQRAFNWLIKHSQILLTVVTLIITLIYGAWGIHLSNVQVSLSQKQDSTSLDLLHFSELLYKMDSVINISNETFKLNLKEQKIANRNFANSENGNMNKLYDKLQRIYALHLIISNQYNNMELTEKNIIDLDNKIEKIKDLFVDEMDNPYLNNNDTINILWNMFYSRYGKLKQQIENNMLLVGQPVVNLNTGVVEIMKIDTLQIKKTIKLISGDIFFSIGALTGYTFNKIEDDKIKKGILDENGKSKINPKDFYK